MQTLMAQGTFSELKLRIWKNLTSNLQSIVSSFIPAPGFFNGLKVGFIPLVIVANLVFLGYTSYVVSNLRQDTQESVANFAFFYRIANSNTYTVKSFGEDARVVLNTLSKSQIPMVITNADGIPLLWKNIDIPSNSKNPADLGSVKEMVHRFDSVHSPYIFEAPPQVFNIASDNTTMELVLHYGAPRHESQIFWWYVIALSMIALLLAVGYIGYQNAQKVKRHPES